MQFIKQIQVQIQTNACANYKKNARANDSTNMWHKSEQKIKNNFSDPKPKLHLCHDCSISADICIGYAILSFSEQIYVLVSCPTRLSENREM